MTLPPLALSRLLQLASPTLPVGAYTYSQGLEWAVEEGRVRNEAEAGRWISDLLMHGIGRYEAPLVAHLIPLWQGLLGGAPEPGAEIARLNGDFLASRETAELRAETVQMGFSLVRLVHDLNRQPQDADAAHSAAPAPALALAPLAEALARLSPGNAPPELAFPIPWAGLAAAWAIPVEAALTAYLWSWAENQVMAALKAVPLGQAAGQRLLVRLGAALPGVVAQAQGLPESRWTNFTPAFALASARHETQYSRLFRS